MQLKMGTVKLVLAALECMYTLLHKHMNAHIAMAQYIYIAKS